MSRSASRKRPGDALWIAAQWLVLGATIALVVGLWFRPEPTLRLLWFALIPVLPAVFMISPPLWRNICPLATLNTFTGHRTGSRDIGPEAWRWATAVGIVLLIVLVPARRLLFNTDGPALVAAIVGAGSVALLMGVVFRSKSGFCNSICPILPVERLYGQRPLMRVRNPRCQPCERCTRIGCLDRTPLTAATAAIGDAADSIHWMFTPFGIFAAAFPGVIIGYYTTSDSSIVDAVAIYGGILQWVVASMMTIFLLGWSLGVSGTRMLRYVAAASLSLYYWLTAPGVADAWGLASGFTFGVRALALLLAVAWLFKFERRPLVRLEQS